MSELFHVVEDNSALPYHILYGNPTNGELVYSVSDLSEAELVAQNLNRIFHCDPVKLALALLLTSDQIIDEPNAEPYTLKMAADLAQERGELHLARMLRSAKALLKEFIYERISF